MSSTKLANQIFVSLFLLCNFLLFNLTQSQDSQPLLDCHPHDKRTLLLIKNHLNNPSSLSTWTKSEKYCCSRYDRVWCDPQGRVVSVEFYDILEYHGKIPPFLDLLPALTEILFGNIPHLSGPLPSYIGNLTNLTWLTIFSTNLGGPIPEPISRLTNLNGLAMSNNNHVGPIPGFLTLMPNLTQLDLSSNRLTGPIPSFLGRLTGLTFLHLSENKLTGPIPLDLAQLTNLHTLRLSSNKLSGPIPELIGHQLKGLNVLELDSNFLSGRIPESLGLLPALEALSLSRNQLTGPIPKSLGRANIVTVKLDRNKLSGDASFFFSKTNTGTLGLLVNNNQLKFDFSNVEVGSLLRFDISHNMIYGSLPKWFGQLPFHGISFADVSYNQLCGPIPNGRHFKRFSPRLFAHNKCLCGGPLPACKL